MARKYTLSDLVNWGHIRDYEAKKLIELGFTDVCYEDRISTINNIDKTCNYHFWTSKSRKGYMSFSLARKVPYEEIFPNNNKYCRSLWQCIKKYIELETENKKKVEVF